MATKNTIKHGKYVMLSTLSEKDLKKKPKSLVHYDDDGIWLFNTKTELRDFVKRWNKTFNSSLVENKDFIIVFVPFGRNS